MSTVVDYVNRLYDLAVFGNVQAVGEAQLTQSLFGDNSGAITTGVNKLCQRVAIELLTESASLPYDQDSRGTELLGTLRRGELRTEMDVYAAFSFAAARIERLFSSLETTSDVDEERLASLNLDQLVLSPDLVKLYITVTTAAGTSRTVILPITTLP